MSRTSLTELYRRNVAANPAGQLPDAELLAARLAVSPAHAELARFERELEPLSADLSAALAAAFDIRDSSAHRRAASSRRATFGSRRWRGAAALSAALIAAVAMFNMHRVDVSVTAPPQASARSADRIFAAYEDGAIANASRGSAGDQIFRGEFRSDMHGDEIFNSRTHDG